MLTIAPEKIGFIITLLKEFESLVPESGLNDGENPSDHAENVALEDTSDNPVEAELVAFIDNLNIDEKLDLVTLMWVGRGDYTEDQWTDARQVADDEHEGHSTSGYLLGTPNAAEFLQEGLNTLGYSVTEVEEDFQA